MSTKIQAQQDNKTDAAMKASVSLMEKLDAEIQSEQDTIRLLQAVVRAKKLALAQAKAVHGVNADTVGICNTYAMVANQVDPKSMGISEYLTEPDATSADDTTVRILMTNGSVRLMDVDVAMALSEHTSHMAALQDMPTVSDTILPKEVHDKLVLLSELLGQTEGILAQFAADVLETDAIRKKELEQQALQDARMRMASCTYFFEGENSYKNRKLPDAMSTLTMQRELALQLYGITR